MTGPSSERTADADTIRHGLNGPLREMDSRAWKASLVALDALVADLDRLAMKADCGGTNCGKCQQCLTVHEYFLKESVTALRAEVERERARADRAEAALAKADKAASRAHDAMWAMNFDKTAASRDERDEWKRLRKQASDHIWKLHEAARAALSAGSGGRETTP